jgi:hypothetical protein
VCSDHKAWRCTVRRETWQHPSEPARTANGSPGSRNGIGVRRRCTARQRCTAASGWDASCGGARGSAGCRAATVGECPGGGEGRQGRRCRAGLRPDELCGPVGHGGSAVPGGWRCAEPVLGSQRARGGAWWPCWPCAALVRAVAARVVPGGFPVADRVAPLGLCAGWMLRDCATAVRLSARWLACVATWMPAVRAVSTTAEK